VFADKDIEDHPVDGVIGAIAGYGANLGFLLAEAVHTALALLVPGRVPGKITGQHGVEVRLKVYSLCGLLMRSSHQDHGRPISKRSTLKPALKKAGIEYRPLMQTRHIFATIALSEGENIGSVQKYAGSWFLADDVHEVLCLDAEGDKE